MNKTKSVHFIAVLLAVVLMVLPYGGVLKFATPHEGGNTTSTLETFSYFDPMLYGYGNFGPFLAALFSSVLLILLMLVLLFLKESPSVRIAMVVMSSCALFSSLLPLIMYGVEFFTMTGLLISFLLACSLLMSIQRLTGKYFDSKDEEE